MSEELASGEQEASELESSVGKQRRENTSAECSPSGREDLRGRNNRPNKETAWLQQAPLLELDCELVTKRCTISNRRGQCYQRRFLVDTQSKLALRRPIGILRFYFQKYLYVQWIYQMAFVRVPTLTLNL